MATIYKFLIEEQTGGGRASGGRKSTTPSAKSVAKTKSVKTPKGTGVEHNRKMRAINPLINKATGGLWEKTARAGRATGGLLKFSKSGAFLGISATAVAILIALSLEVSNKLWEYYKEKAEKENLSNYKKLMVGREQLSSSYRVNSNFIDGKVSFNENK